MTPARKVGTPHMRRRRLRVIPLVLVCTVLAVGLWLRHVPLTRSGGMQPEVQSSRQGMLDCRMPERLGDSYGGWYLCKPARLTDLAGALVYTIGVGRNIEWDRAMIARYGTVHHGWDPTPTALDFTQKTSVPDGFVFHAVGLAAKDGNLTLKLPTQNFDSYTVMGNKDEARNGSVVSVPVWTLESMMRNQNHSRLAILKIDIEGAEFDVIDEWVQSGYKPRTDQLLIEFHERYFQHKPRWQELVPQAVAKLDQLGFMQIKRTQLEISFANRDSMQ